MKTYVVAGAGIVGASAAYHLAKSGARVTIVDRRHTGQATDAAAGIICPWLSQRRNKAWYEMVKLGARYYPALIEELEALGEAETGYRRVGTLALHTDYDKLENMAARARNRREDAPEIGDITILSPSKTQALFPPLSEAYGAVYVSGGARVNGRALRDALIRAAQKLGAEYIQESASLVVEHHAAVGVRIQERIIAADSVIVTGGAWAHELLAPLGLRFSVTGQKAQIVHLQLPNVQAGLWPVVMPPNDQYMLSFEDGRIVVGATHEDDAAGDNRVTAGGVHEVLSKALAVAPGLADGELLETRVGFRPFTPGFLPVIGAVPNYDRLFVANGLGASGLTAGPFVGRELARLACGEETELDLNNYDVAGALDI